MRKYFIGLIALLSPLAASNAAEDICQFSSISMPASTPTSQFSAVTGNDDVMIDDKTGLMWLRCTYGFEWQAGQSTCLDFNGSVFTWEAALDLVVTENANNLYGYNDWRLPNLKELASIVERKCVSVSINNAVFPGAKQAMYWTNTHSLDSTSIRIVDFSGGVVGNSVTQNSLLYFRLVRDIP